MTGIPAPSLRNWEKRYGFPLPARTNSGHRYYCSHDVEFLKKAIPMIEKGHPLSEIASLYKKCKAQHLQVYATEEVVQITDDVSYRVELLYSALMKFDYVATHQHYCILNAKLSPDQLFDRVFEVILRRMGEEWGQGKISIAQEHYGSSFVRLKLSAFLSLELPTTNNHRILAATLSNDRHEGGLLLVAAQMKFKGYRVDYFGVDLPIQDLKLINNEIRPTVIALSYLEFSRLLLDLEELKKMKVPIIIGGFALYDQRQVDQLKSELPNHIYLCQKKVGSQAAEFVEMICQSK